MHFLATIPDFSPSRAWVSDADDTDTAVVFVHGFLGNPIKTWMHFQTLVDTVEDEIASWRACDLYFYGYRSVADPIDRNAQLLAEFLHHVFPRPNSEWLESLLDQHPDRIGLELDRVCLRDVSHPYSKLILVGHSEGGLILRRAIADIVGEFHRAMEEHDSARPVASPDAISREVRARGEAEGWSRSRISGEITRRLSMLAVAPEPQAPAIARAKLRLFAPALMGARPSRLLGWLDASLIGAPLRPFFKASVAYNDMSSGSEILTAVRDHTEFYSARYPKLTALRANVLWGDKEAIVQVGNYRDDSRSRFAQGHDHVSVCKPEPDFLLPLQFTRA
jgi:hypothetical protein